MHSLFDAFELTDVIHWKRECRHYLRLQDTHLHARIWCRYQPNLPLFNGGVLHKLWSYTNDTPIYQVICTIIYSIVYV